MAPPLDNESQKLLDGAKRVVKMLVDQDKKVRPLFEKMAAGLRQGIADGSEDQIAFYLPELRKAAKQVDDCLNTVSSALAVIANLRRDQAVMAARFADVEELLKIVAPVRKRLLGYVDDARDLDKKGEQAAAAARTSSASADADLAVLKDQVADQLKQAEAAVTQADKLEKAAREAFKTGKQKPLTDARVALIEIGGRARWVPLMRQKVEKFRKQYPDLDRDRKAEAQWLLDDLAKIEGWYKDIDKVAKELVALGQVPVADKKAPAAKPAALGKAEVAKIGKLLGIDGGAIADLGKLLNKHPHVKWPAELVKAFGLSAADVKAKMSQVNKLPFVQKLYLIDI